MNPEHEKFIDIALGYAACAHRKQRRKYSGEPYIVHPIAVASIVREVTDDHEMIAAALLHDTVEDTDVTIEEIAQEFGKRVAILVSDLTDVSRPHHGNRAARRELDRQHTANACPDAKTIKLADLLHNTADICAMDPDFAVVYMKEKELVLPFLIEGDRELFSRANRALQDYKQNKRKERL